MEVPSGVQGTVAHTSFPNKQQNEFWELVPVTNPKFRGDMAFGLRSFSGLMLDVFGGQPNKGAFCGLWAAHGGDNQVWIFVRTQ